MKTNVTHTVLNHVEAVPADGHAAFPSIALEAVEILVMFTLIYGLLYRYRRSFPKDKRHLAPEE